MELGDSVYAAERIMKKRIRKVSFTSFAFTNTATDPNLAKPAFEITYQPQLLFGAPYCKLHVSQQTIAYLFLLAPNFKTCLNNALYK